jgi:K+-sensing histidine kinase KdpD
MLNRLSIIDYATQRNIDLIVIGTRGRTGLKRLFMGSVPNGVVQCMYVWKVLVEMIDAFDVSHTMDW